MKFTAVIDVHSTSVFNSTPDMICLPDYGRPFFVVCLRRENIQTTWIWSWLTFHHVSQSGKLQTNLTGNVINGVIYNSLTDHTDK